MVCGKHRFLQWRGILILTCAAAPILWGLLSAPAQVFIGRGGRPADPNHNGKAVPMVNVDDELTTFLDKARKLIEGKSYGEAIDILQAMMRRKELGFVPTEEGRRFVSLRVKAVELIGKMDADGLKKYREAADPPAEKMYQDALSKSDVSLLREVADRYLYTSFGPAALESLGEMEFDRGRFLQAAHCWHQLSALQKAGRSAEESLTLAKAAVAYHLAGEDELSQQIFGDLQARYAEAQADVGGHAQSLTKFVQRIRSIPPGGREGSARQAQQGWPGEGALSGNYGTMSDCDVVLLPRWVDDANRDYQARDISSLLIAGKTVPSGMQQRLATTARLRGGQVVTKWTGNPNFGSTGSGEYVQPPMIHPVVVGDTVIFRLSQFAVAHDIVTGDFRWRTVAFPMERKIELNNNNNFYYGADMGTPSGDNGRYAITAADGKVFMLGAFVPASAQMMANIFMGRGNAGAKEIADTSSLLAASVENEGTVLWRIGEGGRKSEDELLNACKFLSAPAYRAGRLYVMAMYTENYYLLCLNADTGSLIWKTQVAQTPPVMRGYYPGGGMPLDIGSVPAIADGRVYALTNTGVVAAFEADSGQPIWAYQYESSLGTGQMYGMVSTRGRGRPYSPANPVLVVGGRVVCLPADGRNVLALEGESGKLLWQADREEQDDLTGIDDSRVVISGDRLRVLSVADGKRLPPSAPTDGAGYFDQAEKIVGRPAVTPNAVLACGDGKVFRLDLETYRLTTMGPSATDALLGNLVAVNSKLIAANAAGVCAYFSYDMARDTLTQRLDKASPQEKGPILQQRAILSFSAHRYQAALDDFLAAAKSAEEAGDSALASQIRPRLVRTYVALANDASKNSEMLAYFQKAQSFADSKQEKAHMLIRLSKYYRKAGDLEASISLAQELSEQYAAEELVDVRIGAEADDLIRNDSAAKTRGKELGQNYVEAMIEVHGRECYAKFDALAADALAKARAADDPDAMLAVADRWMHSTSASAARFAAAETYYTRALTDKDQADELYGLAIGQLSAVANMKGCQQEVSATVALAAIYARGNRQIAARLMCDAVRDRPADTPVQFADIKGKLGEVLESIQNGKVPTSPIKVVFAQSLALPLKEQFKVASDAAFVLRDQDFQPIRIGESVFVIRGNRAILLDTASRSFDETNQRWVGLTSLDGEQLRQYSSSNYAPGMRLIGGMSKDGKILAVADRSSVTGFEIESAKRAWHATMAELGAAQFHSMAIGDGVLVVCDVQGGITCLDLSKGDIRWKANLVGGVRQPTAPPMIGGGVAVIRSNGSRTLTALNLTTGKVVGKWEAMRMLDTLLTKEGILTVMVDGVLTVREVSQIDKPFWTKKYDQNTAALLALTNGQLAVLPSFNAGTVELLAVAGGNEQGRLQAGQIDAANLVPVDVTFAGDIAYVQSSMGAFGRGKAYGQMSFARGLVLQKFDLSKPTGKPLWTARLDTAGGGANNGTFIVQPLAASPKYVVVTARQGQVGSMCCTFVVDAENGEVREKIDLMSKDMNKDAARRGSVGPAVMTSGRLLLETIDGLTVMGPQ